MPLFGKKKTKMSSGSNPKGYPTAQQAPATAPPPGQPAPGPAYPPAQTHPTVPPGSGAAYPHIPPPYAPQQPQGTYVRSIR